MHLVLSCYIIIAVAADQLLMSTTTPGTAPFCTRVFVLSYLKFEFMILHQLIVNLFEKRGWNSWGEEANFCPQFNLQAHNHNEDHGLAIDGFN